MRWLAYSGKLFGREQDEWINLKRAIFMYSDLFDDLLSASEAEYKLWRSRLQRMDVQQRHKTSVSALDHSSGFPNISLLLQMFPILSIVNAETEKYSP